MDRNTLQSLVNIVFPALLSIYLKENHPDKDLMNTPFNRTTGLLEYVETLRFPSVGAPSSISHAIVHVSEILLELYQANGFSDVDIKSDINYVRTNKNALKKYNNHSNDAIIKMLIEDIKNSRLFSS